MILLILVFAAYLTTGIAYARYDLLIDAKEHARRLGPGANVNLTFNTLRTRLHVVAMTFLWPLFMIYESLRWAVRETYAYVAGPTRRVWEQVNERAELYRKWRKIFIETDDFDELDVARGIVVGFGGNVAYLEKERELRIQMETRSVDHTAKTKAEKKAKAPDPPPSKPTITLTVHELAVQELVRRQLTHIRELEYQRYPYRQDMVRLLEDRNRIDSDWDLTGETYRSGCEM